MTNSAPLEGEAGAGTPAALPMDRSRSLRASHYFIGTLILIAASILLRWPTLYAGWFLDDYNQQSLLTGNMLPKRGMWGMHDGMRGGDSLAMIRSGALPWWTVPTMVFAPLRPLTSVLIWYEYHLVPNPVAMHAVSFALWVLFAAFTARVYWALLEPRAALLATAVFSLSPVQCHGSSWVSSQALLVAALFGAAALAAYVRFRESGKPVWGALSAGLYALSVLGGEYGLSYAGYFLAYEIFLAPGSLRSRARHLIFAGVISAGYLAWHYLGGYGTRGVSTYVDIFAAPLHFVEMIAQSIPSHVVRAFGGYPVDVAEGGFTGWAILTLLAVVALFRFAGLLQARLSPAGRAGAFFVAGGLLSTIPYGAVFYTPRLGAIPQIGFAGGLAIIIVSTIRALRARPKRGAAYWSAAVATAFLVLTHVFIAPYAAYREAQGITARFRVHQFRASRAPVAGGEGGAPEHVFLMSALNVPIAQTTGLARVAQGRPFAMWRVLSPAFGPHHLIRTSERSFTLQTMSAGIFSNPTAAAYRRIDAGLDDGTVIRTDELTVTVIKRGVLGPFFMHFEFEEPLESPKYRFVLAVPNGFELFRPPPVGEDVIVPPAYAPEGFPGD